MTTVPTQQSATLTPGESAQFQTSPSVNQILAITNSSTQEAAQVQINCPSWGSDKPSMPITISPYNSYSHTKILGGASMLIVNVTNPNNPATVQTTLSVVG